MCDKRVPDPSNKRNTIKGLEHENEEKKNIHKIDPAPTATTAKKSSHPSFDEGPADGRRIEGGGLGIERHHTRADREYGARGFLRSRERQYVAPPELELPEPRDRRHGDKNDRAQSQLR